MNVHQVGLLLAISLISAPTSHAADRVALVIGNNAYEHATKLTNPRNDADAVAASLTEAGYTVTPVRDGDVRAMVRALSRFCEASKGAESALFFFAGHGIEVDGQNFLLPVDAELAEKADLQLESLPLQKVLDQLGSAGIRLKVVVLDCCRNNPFAGSRSRSWMQSRSTNGGLAEVDQKSMAEGTMLVFAGEPGKTVPDGGGDHSPFTNAMLDQFQAKAGRPVLEVFTGVATTMVGSQKPWMRFDGSGVSLAAFMNYPLLPGGGNGGTTEESGTTSMAATTSHPSASVTQHSLPPSDAPIRIPTPDQCDPGHELVIGGEDNLLLKLRWCPPGNFLMGSPDKEAGRDPDETQHRVTLSQGFWMGQTEVTQDMYLAFLGKTPSYQDGSGQLPVEQVSWDEAKTFVEMLNLHFAGALPKDYRFELPTEAQWEYACRAGTQTPFHFGTALNGLHANCDGKKPYGGIEEGPFVEGTVDVETYGANPWGLADMHGNVWEWCRDWYKADLTSADIVDPEGPNDGSARIFRGGSWDYPAKSCRAAERTSSNPNYKDMSVGFRISLSQSSN